jgi:acetyl esterase
MSLDAQVKAILDQLAEAGGPKLSELPTAEARAFYEAMSTGLDSPDVPVGGVEDIEIEGAGGKIPIRVYTPVAAGGGPLAALVFYHGGGWVIGNIASHDAVCRALAQSSGCKIFSVDYRLAPEEQFPAAVEDAYAAVQWLEGNASSNGVDPNNIAVGGDSAGGNLAAVVSQMAKDQSGPHIAYQLLIYPVTQCRIQTESRKELAEGYFLELETMKWFEDTYLRDDADAKDPRASPLLADDLTGLPPAYVITAGFDPLKDEGKQYADNMRAAGVDVKYACYDSLVHGFFNMANAVDAAKSAVDEAGATLKEFFA